MRESLAVTKLMKEAEVAIEQCPICRERGHEMCCCPHLAEWLQIKFARKPGLSPRTIWTAACCCFVVALFATGLWKLLY